MFTRALHTTRRDAALPLGVPETLAPVALSRVITDTRHFHFHHYFLDVADIEDVLGLFGSLNVNYDKGHWHPTAHCFHSVTGYYLKPFLCQIFPDTFYGEFNWDPPYYNREWFGLW